MRYKMTIQWFPGHMTRAKKGIKDLKKEVDVVIELLDARAPLSSCNPLLRNIIEFKKTVRLLNKSDLADPVITDLWLKHFRAQKNTIAITGAKDNKKQRNQIIKLCEELAPTRNSFEKPLRVMITGIPNVGKSTLINQLIDRKSAKTGDIPAVTKANQCLVLRDDFLVYDTPGMMWEKIEHDYIGNNLALCNSIGRNALDYELLAVYLLEYLNTHYQPELLKRYKLEPETKSMTGNQLLELVGKKRGCLIKGGLVDLQKISELIIQDFRDGLIGRVSLETPAILSSR